MNELENQYFWLVRGQYSEIRACGKLRPQPHSIRKPELSFSSVLLMRETAHTFVMAMTLLVESFIILHKLSFTANVVY